MGIIMIKCPVTGRDASTGIETIDIEELPAVTAKMVCPACGRVHDWIKTNAWLAHSGEQYRLGSTPARHSRTTSIQKFARVSIRARLSPRPRMPSLGRCHAFGCGTMRI